MIVRSAQAMEALGGDIAPRLTGGDVVFLQGGLGAGKTTLVRGMLHALGHEGAVKSPTYTLVEPYRLNGIEFYHFDLYRIEDHEELEMIGARECFSGDSVALIEWPDRGAGFIDTPSLELTISINADDSRTISASGRLDLDGLTAG